MTCIKVLPIVALLAASLGAPAHSSLTQGNLDRIGYICNKIIRATQGFSELESDGEKALEFVKDWLEQKGETLGAEWKILPAWEAVSRGEACSSTSWQNVLILTRCLAKLSFDLLRKPLRDYTNKCLSAEYVSKKVKSESGGLFSSSVSFISNDFIKKYYEDNAGERPLHLNPIEDVEKRAMENCCRPDKSYGAVLQTIEQLFAKKGKDPRKKFHGKAAKLESYLNRKLFVPCENYSWRLGKLKSEFEVVSKHFVGGEEALLASLDQDAQTALFRLKYCSQLAILTGNVVNNVAKRL